MKLIRREPARPFAYLFHRLPEIIVFTIVVIGGAIAWVFG